MLADNNLNERAIWTWEITSKTNLDRNGTIDVSFILFDPKGKELTIDGKPVEFRAGGNPTDIVGNIQREAMKFIQQVDEESKLQVGDRGSFEV